jgi:hypothetical protein
VSLSGVLPELVRNIRIQLRPRRLFAVLLISFLGSVSAYIYYIDSANSGGSSGLLSFLVNVAVTVLAIGGGVYCLQSIHREMELNTFDYQRITRLTPLELVLGKLFGAPSLVYFIVLCLLPATLLAAYLSHLAVSTFFAVYIVLLLGSIALHALALSMSALVGRGNSAGSIILFLLLFYIFALLGANRDSTLALQGLSPYFVNQLLNPGVPPYQQLTALPAGQDLLLGHPVSHVLVLLVLYLTFTAWFLLGLVRNVKRDPAVYEIYSPLQGFCFILYIHLIVLAFFQWTRLRITYVRAGIPQGTEYLVAPSQAELEFLAISLWLFILFGFALLRNRERARRRIHRLGAKASGIWAALWPAPYLLVGFMGTGFAMIAMIQHELHPDAGWSMDMALFEVCFLAAWIARDGLYLQWMNLRRGRRPLVTAIIYMIVFYSCAGALNAAFGWYKPTAHGAYLLPWSVFSINLKEWTSVRGAWIGALVALVLESLVFAALQRRELKELRESSVS